MEENPTPWFEALAARLAYARSIETDEIIRVTRESDGFVQTWRICRDECGERVAVRHGGLQPLKALKTYHCIGYRFERIREPKNEA